MVLFCSVGSIENTLREQTQTHKTTRKNVIGIVGKGTSGTGDGAMRSNHPPREFTAHITLTVRWHQTLYPRSPHGLDTFRPSGVRQHVLRHLSREEVDHWVTENIRHQLSYVCYKTFGSLMAQGQSSCKPHYPKSNIVLSCILLCSWLKQKPVISC